MPSNVTFQVRLLAKTIFAKGALKEQRGEKRWLVIFEMGFFNYFKKSHVCTLNGFSLLWMLRTWRWRFELMEKDLSQYLHLYGCSPVWVRKWRVKLADLGNIFPQNRHVYLAFGLDPWFVTMGWSILGVGLKMGL